MLALVWIARRYPGMNIAVQAALGTAFITAAELAVGLVVNRALGLQVWDYSREFGNVLGQIDVYKRQVTLSAISKKIPEHLPDDDPPCAQQGDCLLYTSTLKVERIDVYVDDIV